MKEDPQITMELFLFKARTKKNKTSNNANMGRMVDRRWSRRRFLRHGGVAWWCGNRGGSTQQGETACR